MILSQGMFDSFELSGFWWEPGTETKFPGILKFDRGQSLRLEIVRDSDWTESATVEHELFHGEVSGQTAVTLFECQLAKAKGDVFTYRVKVTFIGAHFAQPKDICFSQMRLHVTNLEHWCAETPFERASPTPPAEEGSVSIQYRRIQPKECILSTHNLWFGIFAGFSQTELQNPYVVRWSHQSKLCIGPDRGRQSWDWFMKHIRAITDLISVCLGEPSYVDQLTGVEFMKEVQIFYPQHHAAPAEKVIESVLTIPDMESAAPQVLSTWLSLHDKINTPIELLIGTLKDLFEYPRTHFLSLNSALEGAYGSLQTGTVYEPNKTKFKKYTAQLLKHVPKRAPAELQERFKGQIQNSNRHSLRTMLERLVLSLPPELQCLITKRSSAQFAKEIVALRNSLTHTGGEDIEQINLKLVQRNQQLRLLMLVLLLKRLGISTSKIQELISNNRRYRPGADPDLHFFWNYPSHRM